MKKYYYIGAAIILIAIVFFTSQNTQFFEGALKKIVSKPPPGAPQILPDLKIDILEVNHQTKYTDGKIWFKIGFSNIGDACASNFKVTLKGLAPDAPNPDNHEIYATTNSGAAFPVYSQLCNGANAEMIFSFDNLGLELGVMTTLIANIDSENAVHEINEKNNNILTKGYLDWEESGTE